MKTIKEKVFEEYHKTEHWKEIDKRGYHASTIIDLTLKEVLEMINERIKLYKDRLNMDLGFEGKEYIKYLEGKLESLEELKAKIEGE